MKGLLLLYSILILQLHFFIVSRLSFFINSQLIDTPILNQSISTTTR